MSGQRKSGYFRQQIVLNSVLGVLFSVFGMTFMLLSPVDQGYGLICFLAGLGFFGALISVIRKYRRMSKEQRAVYAWAIAQQMSGTGFRTPGGDIEMMAILGCIPVEQRSQIVDSILFVLAKSTRNNRERIRYAIQGVLIRKLRYRG